MAITIIKEPSGIYPAFNDSFLQFKSSLDGNERAEVTVFPQTLFPNTFTIFADLDGLYTFNLKEAVKTVLNISGGFEDSDFFTNAFFKSISGNYLEQGIQVEVFGTDENETFFKNYTFYRSVKQVGERVFDNEFQLLLPSVNGVDYYAEYWEGFPFQIDVSRVVFSDSKEIVVKNRTTGFETLKIKPDFTGILRLNVDRSDGENWTKKGILPLRRGLNRLEFYEDGDFRLNLTLLKKERRKGVLLKWFNNQGGYSHWLFDPYFSERLKSKDLDLVSSNQFLNVGEFGSEVRSIGKSSRHTLKLRTKADQKAVEVLKGLFVSPHVEVYTSQDVNLRGSFVAVEVEETFDFSNKKSNNDFEVTIMLPEPLNITL